MTRVKQTPPRKRGRPRSARYSNFIASATSSLQNEPSDKAKNEKNQNSQQMVEPKDFTFSDEESMFMEKEHMKNPHFCGYVRREDIFQCSDAVTLFHKGDFINHLKSVIEKNKETKRLRERKKRKSINSLGYEEQIKLAMQLSKEQN